MINSCLNSTFRICNTVLEVILKEVELFVNKSIKKDDLNRINISKLIRWCSDDEDIRRFFTLIGKDPPEKMVFTANELVRLMERPESQIPKHLRLPERLPRRDQPGFIINQQSHFEQLRFVSKFTKNLSHNYQDHVYIKQLRAQLNWVYGFRCGDISHCVFYHQAQSKHDQKLLYMCGSVVIIFYYNLNLQKHYTAHDNEVISLAVGQQRPIAASGDLGEKCSIHIWEIESTKTLKQLTHSSLSSVSLLRFLNRDRFLVVVTRRHDSPIYIFDLHSGHLITSCHADSFVFDSVLIHDLRGRLIEPKCLSSFEGRKTSPLLKNQRFKTSGMRRNGSGQETTAFVSQMDNKLTWKTRNSNFAKSGEYIGNVGRGAANAGKSEGYKHVFGSERDLLSLDINKNFFLLSKTVVYYFEFRGNNYFKKNIFYPAYLVPFYETEEGDSLHTI